MKKELRERKETGVLYEPPEPLFPEALKKTRVSYFKIAVGVSFLLLVTILFVLIVSGESDRDQDGYVSDAESVTECYTEENEGIDHSTEEKETYECETGCEESGSGTSEESEAIDTEEESETVLIDVGDIESADLSQIEKGDSYIINYTDKSPDIIGLVDRGFTETEKRGGEAPIVMIVHTHTSEKYLGDAASDSPLDGVVAVGDTLNARLNALGVSSLHCTVIHDGDASNAYLNARDTIETMLEIYPSIKYIIDLHRIGISADGTPIKTVSGCGDRSAQIRFTVSSESGRGWQEDLSLVLALRHSLNRNGTRVCMPPVLTESRYNSDLSKYYIMADIGAVGNNVDEAKAAAKRLASAFANVILEK